MEWHLNCIAYIDQREIALISDLANALLIMAMIKIKSRNCSSAAILGHLSTYTKIPMANQNAVNIQASAFDVAGGAARVNVIMTATSKKIKPSWKCSIVVLKSMLIISFRFPLD